MRTLLREGVKFTRVIRIRLTPILILLITIVATMFVSSLAKPQVVEAIVWENSLVTTELQDEVLIGAYDPDGALNDFDLDIEHYFVDWVDHSTLRFSIENARWKERIPMITLEPWPNNGEMESLLEDINRGEYDDVIRKCARTVAWADPQQVIIRWGHEMELSEIYPWSGNPQEYKNAYKRVVNIFEDEGVTNILWLWSPAGGYDAILYYPGGDYVDYVGVTVLSDPIWDMDVTGKDRPTYADYAARKFWVAEYFQKPLIVAELGIVGTDSEKIRWLEGAFGSIDEHLSLKALVYFNDENVHEPDTKEYFPDWRITQDVWSSLIY
jgi:endoglucanase